MKNINLTFALCALFSLGTYGQTQSLSDVVVASEKGIILTMLTREKTLRDRQRVLLDLLSKEEGKFADKRGVLDNFSSNGVVYLGLVAIMKFTEDRIAATAYNIKMVKIQKLGFRHGLKGYESNLENEKRYFSKLKHEFDLLTLCMPVSGGNGYNYTAILKLLLRTMQIRQNVLLINKEVKGLMNANIILAR